MNCTKAWYELYQTVVGAVPKCGTRRTNRWYFPYQTQVLYWYLYTIDLKLFTS
ncbi:hypothetical protein BACSTE_03333 [Bacteroides stercoris ATCC 43183]|uniref:Uncharacterized protein n=1 Tax=Bacteroides stercoris ATCC 43183 TaxID=449673 RepID=B0NUZ6_BACSE|nr:hypothetical protein BACSTE_03333 [Bacteroides stercoris ATCC 43183]